MPDAIRDMPKMTYSEIKAGLDRVAAEASRYDPRNAPRMLREMAVMLKDAATNPCMEAKARSHFCVVAINAELMAGELDRVMPLLAKDAQAEDLVKEVTAPVKATE